MPSAYTLSANVQNQLDQYRILPNLNQNLVITHNVFMFSDRDWFAPG
jgi:hypothetical protein